MVIGDKLVKKTLSGIYNFNMIQNGDKVIVAISGGKDSLTLLDLLVKAKKSSPLKFDIIPVYVVPMIPGIITLENKLIPVFESYGLDYIIQKMNIPQDSKLLQGVQEAQTCQWCTYTRRITLYKLAEQIGATKIAYGHHKDDIITTLFMNINSSKRLKIMLPVNKMRKGDFSIIRPMVFLREEEIIKYTLRYGITPFSAECPLSKIGERSFIKGVIADLEQKLPGFVDKMFEAYIKKVGVETI